MTTPGAVVNNVDSVPAPGSADEVDTAFVVGIAERGSITAPILVTSMSDYASLLGTRVSYGSLYDWLDAFFNCGGVRAYVGRVVGPTSVKSSANLWDAVGSTAPGDVALSVTAKDPGAWADSLNVEVTAGDAGGEFKIVVSHDTDGTLETSTSLVDRAAAVAWSTSSDYIDLALGASDADPRVQGPTGLTSGDDDRTNIVDAQWATALALFTKDLGPGQLASPGRYTDAGNLQLAVHALTFNRFALWQGVDTPTVATLTAAAAAVRAGGLGRRQGKFLAPHAEIPGLLPGTTRTVDWSAIEAGITARNDLAGHSPNEPAAGELGIAPYVVGLTQSWPVDADRGTLNDAGVNVAIMYRGTARGYGNRTCASSTTEPTYLQGGNMRERMLVHAGALEVLERRVHLQLDSKGTKDLENDIIGEVLKPEFDKGALYPDPATPTDPDTAYSVDAGPSVNTPEVIASGYLKARVAIRCSPAPEVVVMDLAVRRVTESV